MSVGRPSLSVKMLPHVCRAAARRFSTSGFSAERVGPPHACGRRCLCATTLYWQCMVAQIAQAWRRAEAEPAPGSPRFVGALLLRQHRGAPAAAAKRMRLRIGKKMTPAPALAPKYMRSRGTGSACAKVRSYTTSYGKPFLLTVRCEKKYSLTSGKNIVVCSPGPAPDSCNAIHANRARCGHSAPRRVR